MFGKPSTHLGSHGVCSGHDVRVSAKPHCSTGVPFNIPNFTYRPLAKMVLRVQCSSVLRVGIRGRVYPAGPRSTINSTGSLFKPISTLPPPWVTISNHYRFIQNLATPTRPKPTEKIVYGVEEDPDDLLIKAQEAAGGSRTSYPTISYARSITTIHCSSESQRQATFAHRTISSTLSTAATAVHGAGEEIEVTAMRHRSKSESPRGAWQEAQDKQFPQLKLNHVAPNFHALSSHGPIELYEYLSSPLESLSVNPTTKTTANTPARDAKSGNWVVFFSHPTDFTAVCATEIASMVKLQGEFAKRGAKLLGVSIGSVEQHRDWMKEVRKVIEADWTCSGGSPGAVKLAAVKNPGIVQPVSGGYGGVVPVGTIGALDEEKEMGMEDVVGSGSIGITEKATESVPGGGAEKNLLNFPIIADEDGFVSQLYGMLEGADLGTRGRSGMRTLPTYPTAVDL